MGKVISITHKGNFKRTERFFKRLNSFEIKHLLNQYGQQGVEALRSATPVDSGKTAESWYYEVQKFGGFRDYKIVWKNSNINNYIPIAVILQYGHATGTGGYVQGRDYINPAIQPIFDAIAEDAWQEVIGE